MGHLIQHNNQTTITGLSVGDYGYTIYDTTNTSSGPSHPDVATFLSITS